MPNTPLPRPFIDLHRHLDGSVRLQTILELAAAHGVALPANDIEGLRSLVQVTDPTAGLMAFIDHFKYLTAVMVDAAACRRIAYENVVDAAAEGIDHVELRFSPAFMAADHGLDPQAVVEAVADGIEAGRKECDISVGLIGILSRTYGAEACLVELDALLAHRDELVAVDLAGDEAAHPASDFIEHFRRVRDAGLAVTVHAGEAAGADSVWSAIHDLGATRIGHGVAARDDEALMDHLAAERIGLEISLTSNVHTSTTPDYASHPVCRFLEHGVPVALCTDDPGISGIDLRHEYRIAASAAGLGEQQLERIAGHALDMAFIDDAERARIRAGL